MIREVRHDEIPMCVEVIKKSFITVADECGFTEKNAPGFTAFATTTDKLYWHMDGEHRLMYVFEEDGVLCGYYSLLLQENDECELNNLAVLPEYRHKGIGKQLLEHAFNKVDGKYVDITYELALGLDVTKGEYASILEVSTQEIWRYTISERYYGEYYQHKYIKNLKQDGRR